MARWLRRGWEWIVGRFRQAQPQPFVVKFVEGDELPAIIAERTVVVAREGFDLWSAGLLCPCRCGRRIELMLLPGVKPRWDLRVNELGHPTLRPSVWVADGCRSHFWLRDGSVSWCRD